MSRATKYGEWFLVKLDSGRWLSVWHSFLEMDDDLKQATLSEDKFWFSNQCGFAQPSSYITKTEALEKLIGEIESQVSEDSLNYADYYEPVLKRARIALKKALKEARKD